MFTMHGTTMICFVARPYLFGFCQLPGPVLMIGARYNGVSTASMPLGSGFYAAPGGFLLYFVFVPEAVSTGAGSAPTCYVRLLSRTSRRAFSVVTARIIDDCVLVSWGSAAPPRRSTSLQTILWLSLSLMKRSRCRLPGLLNLVRPVMVILAVSPLTAARSWLRSTVTYPCAGTYFEYAGPSSATF